MFDPEVVEPTVDFLARLAEGGNALELGIGTGRIALPLAQRGVRVQGIELSRAMVARLQAKPGAEKIAVTIGDFATMRLDAQFSLVYLVFNTIMNLTTQDQQIACFENAAAHLRPGGCFVIEVGVPDLQRLPPGETIRLAIRGNSPRSAPVWMRAPSLVRSSHLAPYLPWRRGKAKRLRSSHRTWSVAVADPRALDLAHRPVWGAALRARTTSVSSTV
jgi:SAM-dependent methyltransferase